MTITWRRGAAYLQILKERTVREALRNPIEVLRSLTEKSKNESYRFQRLYRNLYNPEFYWLAYKNIYANTGSMTAGTDGTTIDGMSDERIQRIIKTLRDRSYQPKPARREYITKKNSHKKRPLGIQSGNDKLVQEVVKMILESIYEPVFKKTSHGFRPNRSCQTALQQIQKTFTGTNWFVEGDIHACFDSFNHHTLILLLRKRIDDEAFIQLIWKFLKAGYMEQWSYNRTYSGVPQGSGVSPVLANVYLHEFDKFMEDYAQTFNQGKKKKINPEYNKALKRASYYRRKGKEKWFDLTPEERIERTKKLKALEALQRELTPALPMDEAYKRIQYVRYADDFIIGVIGSKKDAEQIKWDVGKFLKDKLDLEMSDTKTKVTHTGDRAQFLGYDITVSRSQDLKKSASGYKIRSNTGVVKLLVPREKWVEKLLEYKAIKIKINENGKEKFVALHRGKLVNQKDIEILTKYNAEVRGLYNYYAIANDSFKIGKFANVMKYSMYKTFACKYKTNVHEIKRRYCVGDLFTVAYDTKAGRKTTTFYRDGFKRKEMATKFDNVSELPQYSKFVKVNTLKQRVERHTCELCNKDCRNLEIHQVKKLKDLKGNAEWILLMRKRRRKTLVVCPECHQLIHSKTPQKE
ncbi:group II intron reverse transcriptase/maturase [Eubacterium sp. AM05-23]|nr:reverse transcriptase/maturase family protein [Eubacterium sp. AM05-23]RHO59580.1 group II intron reverse transcriptase/maturase [Eubacterium sp. AM05-23]